jgi:hypothetical protein
VAVSVLDRQQVADFFGLTDKSAQWLADLSARPTPPPAALPDPATLAEWFPLLAGHPADLAELEELRSTMAQPAVQWLLDRCTAELIDAMGVVEVDQQWPDLASTDDRLNHYFYVYVFLAAVPAVREFHRDRGISEEIGWASLADLGQQMSVYRRIFGRGGIHTQVWLTLPFRGLLYRLGRLQFNLSNVGYDAETISRQRLPFQHGDASVGVHIPEQGRLDGAAVEDSLAFAARFFAAHFPERECRIAICHSWLLDRQLADYLPAGSNIIGFQRRFTPVSDGQVDDAAVFEFVFRKIRPTLDELPQRTALERAVVAHLRAGGHWRVVSGWLELPYS